MALRPTRTRALRLAVRSAAGTALVLVSGVLLAVPAYADPFGPQPVATPDPGLTTRPWFLPVAIAAVALGLFGLLAVAFSTADRENQTAGRMRRRLSRYSLSARPDEPAVSVPMSGALGQSQVARSAVELAGRVVENRDLDTGLGAKLEAAGLPLRSAEWLLVHLGIAVGAGLVATLLTGFSPLATVLGLGLGFAIPFAYLSIKETRRTSAFAAALPDTLQLLAGSLAAGYSLPQAVDSVVRESTGPMAAELGRAIVEARLGVPMEDALDTVATRMGSVDFAWVVMAIRIQREVGGNLAEVLTSVAATMRERERLRRQVQVLSAEGRLSAVILGGLPVVFIVYLALVRPEYIGVLVTNPLGIAMVVVGLGLLLGGGLWLRKVVTVEV
jgi:tight adherence protein B